MNKNLHNSVLYIDMCQLRRNAEAILQELDGAQLIPVLKGNAYGLGQEEVGAALAAIPEIRTMAVAQVSEGAALRRAGVTQDILVLGGVPGAAAGPGGGAGADADCGAAGPAAAAGGAGPDPGKAGAGTGQGGDRLHRVRSDARGGAGRTAGGVAGVRALDPGDRRVHPLRRPGGPGPHRGAVPDLSEGGGPAGAGRNGDPHAPCVGQRRQRICPPVPAGRGAHRPAAVYGPSHRPAGDGPGRCAPGGPG